MTILTMTGCSQTTASSQPAHQACVALLHGLARTSNSMNAMAQALKEAGYHTINIDYESRKHPIEQLAMQVIPEAVQRSKDAKCSTLHFVTHSMGGIVLRYYLAQHPIDNLGRVVMLSPPNQGSQAADILRNNTLYQWFNGPAGKQMITGPAGITAALGPVNFPVGIITGNEHTLFDAYFSNIITGEDDGKVSVESAKVEGMTDFLVVPYPHTYIMNKKEVIAQTIHFLQQGRFKNRVSSPD